MYVPFGLGSNMNIFDLNNDATLLIRKYQMKKRTYDSNNVHHQDQLYSISN